MRNALLTTLLAAAVAFISLAPPAHGQDIDMAEQPWREIMNHEGVHFGYIFYREADSKHNGLVLRLINNNDHAIQYSFTVVLRGDRREFDEEVSGALEPGEYVTGDEAGLFWIPFTDDSVREVGLRGFQVEVVN